MTRALAVLSGDIDSLISAKAVIDQGIDVTGICFKTAFFSYESVIKGSEKLNIELKIIDITDEHLKLVKDYIINKGNIKDLCKGCVSMKLSYALKTLKDIEADFLVISEDYNISFRDLSQEIKDLSAVEDEKEIEGLILRPLMKKHINSSTMDKMGIVDREKFLELSEDINKARIEVSRELGIEEFINYKDVCKLSNPLFSSRLRQLFTYNKYCTVNDIEGLT